MNRRRIVVGAVCAACAAVILLGGCGGGPSDELRALKEDPLARYVPEGGELVDSSTTDAGSTLGKPVYASYRRLFELPKGDPERQLRAALDAAAAAGWSISAGEPFRVGTSMSQTGRKRLSTGEAEMGATVFPEGPPSGRTRGPAMLILLSDLSS